MTDAEWSGVEERLARNWPHQLQPASALEKYRLDLDAFPVEQVLAAIETWYRDGREWPPTGGQVLGRLADLLVDAPAFVQLLAMLRESWRRGEGSSHIEERDGELFSFDPRLRRLGEESPLAAAFVHTVGGFQRTQIRDGFDEARLRQKYEAFVEDARRSLVYGGIDPAGLPALERRVRAPQPRRLGWQEQLFARVERRRLQAGSEAA